MYARVRLPVGMEGVIAQVGPIKKPSERVLAGRERAEMLKNTEKTAYALFTVMSGANSAPSIPPEVPVHTGYSYNPVERSPRVFDVTPSSSGARRGGNSTRALLDAYTHLTRGRLARKRRGARRQGRGIVGVGRA